MSVDSVDSDQTPCSNLGYSVWSCLSVWMFRLCTVFTVRWVVNNVDPDQTPCSHLGYSVWSCLSVWMFQLCTVFTVRWVVNSVDPDQTSRSNLGVHCLVMPVCPEFFGLSTVFIRCPMSSKQCRTWADAALWSVSTLFAQICSVRIILNSVNKQRWY